MNELEHNCDTCKGSSGSPLINSNDLIIGLNCGAVKNKDMNYGCFIGEIIDKLEKRRGKRKKKNRDYKRRSKKG